MEGIQRVVTDMVRACREQNLEVSETLAAFMARAVILDRPERFTPDKPLDEEDVKALIDICVDRLKQQDSPDLETVRLQVAYDTAYFTECNNIDKASTARAKQCDDILSDIVKLQTRGDSDFEGLTELYRRIFMFLSVDSGVDGYEERTIEREIVAAFESVFPRVGLRTFVTLQESDKALQVKELASIVFGIRLFNRAISKGGAGIEDVPGQLQVRLSDLQSKLHNQTEEFCTLCNDYTMTINHMHRQADSKGPPPRLRDELTNRRQFLACLQNLQEDCDTLAERVDMATSSYNEVLQSLQDTVGAKSSVSKEQVYPKFDALSKVWKDAEEDLAQVNARLGVLENLQPFKTSFNSRLRAHDVAAARQALETEPDLVDQDETDHEMFRPQADLHLDETTAVEAGQSEAAAEPAAEEAAAGEAGEAGAAAEGEAQEPAAPAAPGAFKIGPGGAKLYTFEAWRQAGHHFGNVALNRFCPWTISNRDALLLHGKPRLGVIEFEQQFYCFTSELALKEALMGMEGLLEKVKMLARRLPELINLLQLQSVFPEASVAALVEGSLGAGNGKVSLVDSDSQTPTHFVESNIDPSYEWNEWALRRRGVQLANLRQKRTHSTQTALSHFRAEGESQTWLPKDKQQNTLHDAKTQAPKVVSYMTGLRGRPTKQASVVKMTLD